MPEKKVERVAFVVLITAAGPPFDHLSGGDDRYQQNPLRAHARERCIIMFTGNLSKISLAEVLRLLAMSSQTGALVVEEQGFSGMIFLQLGQMVHAMASGLEGVDALNELTRHRDADFAFNEGFTAPTLTLTDYPTDLLIDKLKKRIDELQAREDAMPDPHDFPVYLIGKQIQGLVARPDELTLLLLADGRRTVLDIAQSVARELGDVLETMGKFRHAGVIEIKSAPSSSLPPLKSPPAAPLRPPPNSLPPTNNSTPARYWRGKRIN